MSNSDALRFRALVEPHLDGLFRAAFRLSRQRADAEDLVQETCVRAYLRIGQLRDEQPARAWLLRIMHNLFVDGVRRARLAPMLATGDGERPEDSSASPDPDPETSLCTSQREAQLQRAWLRLDRGHRALLALRAEGYSLAEICEITGLPAEVLNARLYRARRSFARHLRDEPELAPAIGLEIAK